VDPSSAAQTLTFLFTDIEGSTAMLEQLGGCYAGVLADHHQIIRSGLAAHHGREIDTQGDAFFAVFSSPSACVGAAVQMQRALASHPWPGGQAVRVRMGIHSGEAAQTAVGLVGLEVHRAARIAAVAHGGQTVLSAATAALLRDSMPAGTSLRDLGLHRLKDLGRSRSSSSTPTACRRTSPRCGPWTTRSCSTTCPLRCPVSSAATPNWPRCGA
jgi:class 3 adenylate cyclase